MNPQQDEILSDLLTKWENLYRRGQDTPPAELARDYPELASALGLRIKALKAASWMDQQPNDDEIEEPAPAEEASARRTVSNRYRLDEMIAMGGFAEVWRAYDKELQRSVAVKIPKTARLDSASDFMAEARRVARLRHHAIVPVHDVVLEGDHCFIISEFMDGGSLADRLSRGSVPPEKASAWVADIADALDYAHLHGVIHRDVKPANILINHHDKAFLGDFGIAQSANKTGRFDPSIGTLRYMAPEQLEGRPITPVSDVYSLAVVLHEALTGKIPYSSDEPNVVRREIASGIAKRVSPEIAKPIAEVIRKALHRNPQERHASAAHFAQALRSANQNRPKNQWMLWGIVGAVGIFLIPAFSFLFTTATILPLPKAKPALPKPPAVDLSKTISDSKQIVETAKSMTDALTAQAIADVNRDRPKNSAEVLKGLAIAKVIEAKKKSDAGDFEAAAQDMNKAIEWLPREPDFHHKRGSCYFNLKQYEKALEDFLLAGEIEPTNPKHQMHQGYCFTNMGREQEAKAAFDRAEKLLATP